MTFVFAPVLSEVLTRLLKGHSDYQSVSVWRACEILQVPPDNRVGLQLSRNRICCLAGTCPRPGVHEAKQLCSLKPRTETRGQQQAPPNHDRLCTAVPSTSSIRCHPTRARSLCDRDLFVRGLNETANETNLPGALAEGLSPF